MNNNNKTKNKKMPSKLVRNNYKCYNKNKNPLKKCGAHAKMDLIYIN